MVKRALGRARRTEHPTDLPAQTAAAFHLATARPPTPAELQTLTTYATRHGLANACRVILNSNEFVFVD